MPPLRQSYYRQQWKGEKGMEGLGRKAGAAEGQSGIEIGNRVVEHAYRIHKDHCEDWREGRPEAAWRDDDGYLCIKYESGGWWHYNQRAGSSLEWW